MPQAQRPDPYGFRDHFGPVNVQLPLLGELAPTDVELWCSDLQEGCGCEECALWQRWLDDSITADEWRTLARIILARDQ